MKKRYFILLEILIALSLLVLLSIPLIRSPLIFYKKEFSDLKKLELKRLEQECFFEIKEKLYKNEIPWSSFSEKKKESPIYKLGKKKLFIPSFINQDIDVSYRILIDTSKETAQNEIYLKLKVQVIVQTSNFDHILIVKKTTPSQSNPSKKNLRNFKK